MFLMTKAGTVHIVQIVCLGWSSGLRAKCKFVTYCCIRVCAIKAKIILFVWLSKEKSVNCETSTFSLFVLLRQIACLFFKIAKLYKV